MTDKFKMREMEAFLRIKVEESDKAAFCAASRHDSTEADKWRAVSDAYATCYTRLFGELKREGYGKNDD